MKIQKLTIHNIGKIKDTEIEFNKPLNLFYGEIMSGKTTILNAVKLCFGGSFPNDLISHGESEAFVTLEFDNGFIRRSFNAAKDGTPLAKKIEFMKDNKIYSRPVEAIKQFVNPFLLDQNFLINMTELERKRYFCELFDIDLSEAEKEEKKLTTEAKEKRTTIKVIGDIKPIEVEKPDIDILYKEKEKIRFEDEDRTFEFRKNVKQTDEHNNKIEKHKKDLFNLYNKVDILKKQQKEIGELIVTEMSRCDFYENLFRKDENQIQDYIEKPPTYEEVTKEINCKISNCKADEVRYENYQAELQKLKQKQKIEEQLKEINTKLRDVRKFKLQALANITKNSKIDGLEFCEDGSFKFHGTSAGMLSTSQLMILSSMLTNLYPESFGIELIDRAESLGKHILEFEKKAREEEKTILATIVSERPAEIPENIGVFVVENGQVEEQKNEHKGR